MAKTRKDSSAMRTRRYRERRKATVTPTVTSSVTDPAIEPLPLDTSPVVVTPPGTVVATIPASSKIPDDFNSHVTHVTRHRACAVTLSTTASALALATVSACFSITGLTSIFVDAFWPVIAMGVALESGKLSAVGWLARYRATAL